MTTARGSEPGSVPDGENPAREETDAPVKLGPLRMVEVAAALSVVVWRVAVLPVSALWRDWLVILAVFWSTLVVVSSSRRRTMIAASFAAWLLAIYVAGQTPRLLTLLGGAP